MVMVSLSLYYLCTFFLFCPLNTNDRGSLLGGACFLSFKIFIFNWRIIALQCCINFFHTAVWISRKCTDTPSFLKLRPTPTDLATHLGGHRAWAWRPWVMQQLPTSCLLYLRWRLCLRAPLSVRPTLAFSRRVHTPVLHVCISVPVLQIGSSVKLRWMNVELAIQNAVSKKEKNQYCILSHLNGT